MMNKSDYCNWKPRAGDVILFRDANHVEPATVVGRWEDNTVPEPKEIKLSLISHAVDATPRAAVDRIIRRKMDGGWEYRFKIGALKEVRDDVLYLGRVDEGWDDERIRAFLLLAGNSYWDQSPGFLAIFKDGASS